MKSIIVPIAIILGLIVFFVIVDRKDFNCYDNDQRPQTGNSTAEAEPTEKQELEVEAESAETKTAETLAVAETKSTNSWLPAAVPVATPSETEKLNAEAIVFANKHKKRMFFASRGMDLVYDDKMNKYTSVSIAESFDETFKKNGVTKTRSELLTRKIPYQWSIDFNTLTGNCDFDRVDNGYNISSPDGVLTINTPIRQILNTTTGFSFELSGKTAETKVRIGIEEFGLFRPGKTYVGELTGVFEEEYIHFEVSALEHFDSVRPFLEIRGEATIHGLRIYQKEIKGTTCLEGQISERSILPNPKKSDYPNCRYTAQFEGNVIKAGTACPQEVVLIINGFEDFKTLKTDSLKKGDKVICTIIPYDSLSDEEQSIQQADDLNFFTLDNYYLLAAHKINEFAEGDNAQFPASGVYFSDNKHDYISIFDQHINPDVPKELQESQAKAIAEDLIDINEMLKDYDDEKIMEINTAFAYAWNEEKAKDPPGYNRVTVDQNSEILWRKIDESFFSIKPSFSPIISKTTVNDETVEALVELKKALEANGVQLIVSIIQNREPIVARIINEKFRDIVDYQTYSNVKILLEHGVEAISPSKEVVEHFNEEVFAYNVGGDDHPSILAQKKASEILAERIARYNLPKRLKRINYTFVEVEHRFWGSDPLKQYPDNCDIAPHKPGDKILVRKPELQKGFSYTNKNSEILIVGNSFTVSPYSSNGLISWLTYYAETDVSYYEYTMNGPATIFIENLLLNPEKYLRGKKVVVLQFALSQLLNVRWHNISIIDKELKCFSTSNLIESFDDIHVETEISSLNDTARQTRALIPGGFDVKTKADPFELVKISPNKTNKNKGFVVVIPACLLSGSVQIVVNSIEHSLPSSWDNNKSSYQSLIYELPAGTAEISVSVKGNPNSCFVLKNIQIWQ